jgi:hypothetical protein
VPVTLKFPPVVKLPPVIVPVAVIEAGVIVPVILTFPPVMFPVAVIDPAVIMFEIDECRKANTTGYIKVQAFDASKGCESCVHSFIIQLILELHGIK